MRDNMLTIIQRHHDEADFSGVALVKRGDETLVHEAFGLAHRGFEIPNTVDTRFDIASVTKTFTAAAIMQLVETGLVDLETRVMPYLGISDTRISDDVTVFHCLTHTSGIGDDADEEAGEDYELLFVDKPNYSIRETRDFLPQFVEKEPMFPPGQGVRYNNVAFVLLGLVIEQATGRSYREYIGEHIFKLAGMVGANFCAMDSVCANFAEHYKKVEHEGHIEWRKNIYSYPPIGSPDGGATVTALDLDRFVRAIQARELMGDAASITLLSPHVMATKDDNGTSVWSGFAFEYTLDAGGNVLWYSKEGQNAGVASNFAYFPGTDTTIVLLANQDCDVWAIQRELNPLVLG